MRKAAIVGATGYAGVELTRLVSGHPGFDLVMVTSTAEAGRPVSSVYPALQGCPLVYVQPDIHRLAQVADVVFLAVPHTAAMEMVPELLSAGVTVIDVSADFRLRDPDVYATWYGVVHTAPDLLTRAVYGLPELTRAQLEGAELVACPGCYPTAALLAAAPALKAGWVSSRHVIIDAKSGVSGAGRTPAAATHFCAVNESVHAYSATTHRHTPEIAQGLADLGLDDPQVTFVPHLIPMSRGLLATVYLHVESGVTSEDIHGAYRDLYSGEPFVTMHTEACMPTTGEVRGSNRAHIGLALDEAAGVLVATCAIDNLVKGAAGQAVQCANIVFGYPETAGLTAFMPVV